MLCTVSISGKYIREKLVDARENIPYKRETWKEIMFEGINVGV
jgi:hypothetical protein